MNDEEKKLIELIRQLGAEETIEFYHMIKGAAFAAEKQRDRNLNVVSKG